MEEQNRPVPRNFIEDWKDREALAESMIPLIGKLYRKIYANLKNGESIVMAI